MARIIVIGAGVGGLTTAMLLARDGHDVTVLERDPAPPPADADDAWEHWERRGVNQFRMIHMFLPRFRSLLEAELPGCGTRVREARRDPLQPVRRDPRRDDRRDAAGRRAVRRAHGAASGGGDRARACRARQPNGCEVRRGVAVAALRTGRDAADGVPHVVGVRTDAGEDVAADLVVDATGRRSSLPSLLSRGRRARPRGRARGLRLHVLRPSLPLAPTARCRRRCAGSSRRGAPCRRSRLPADNGTWGLGIIASAKDAALRPLKDVDTWMRTWRSYPLVAHWVDGEPIDDGEVAIMAKIEDRHRAFVVDGTPVATGVLAVADSWACTNPSLGRGCSIGFMHAVALPRPAARRVRSTTRSGSRPAWHEVTEQTVEPYYRATLAFDRHRLAEIDAGIEGKDVRPRRSRVRDHAGAAARARRRTPTCSARSCGSPACSRCRTRCSRRRASFEKVVELGAGWRARTPRCRRRTASELLADRRRLSSGGGRCRSTPTA